MSNETVSASAQVLLEQQYPEQTQGKGAKMKLIDWSKLPRGTMTNKGEIIGIHKEGREALIFDGNIAFWKEIEFLRIVQATRWTYHDGGECPVPDGFIIDVVQRDGISGYCPNDDVYPDDWCYLAPDFDESNIIAYRITGVDRAGGFTDCPYEATE